MSTGKPVRMASPRHGLARALSKLGLCSRTEAVRWIAAGRVRVDGRTVLDPEFPTIVGRSRIEVDGVADTSVARRYLMLNKPRGLVTTAADERGRNTVYACLEGANLPWLAPVGRLDRASEGLLLMSNDPSWAAAITDPATGPHKTYHVQVNAIPGAGLLADLVQGAMCEGQWLHAASASVLRSGGRNAWLEITLEEGRNRQIRRLLEAFNLATLRLMRVAIGELPLGTLAKGAWRDLSAAEVRALAAPAPMG